MASKELPLKLRYGLMFIGPPPGVGGAPNHWFEPYPRGIWCGDLMRREPFDEEFVEAVRLIERYPMRCVLDPLVAPFAGDVFARVGHLGLGKGEVTGTPQTHRGNRRRWNRSVLFDKAGGVGVGPIPVERSGQRALVAQVVDP